MDFVGLASSFVTLIGFSMQLYMNCKDYVNLVKGKCPGALKLVLIEASGLRATLEAIKDVLELSETPREDGDRLAHRIGQTMKECQNCLDELLKLVPKPIQDGKVSKKQKAEIYLNALKWSDDKKKIEAELEKLTRHKATLSLGLTAELSYDVKKIGVDVAEVKSNVNTMQAKLDDAQRGRVLKWLERVDPSTNHNRAAETRHDNTGEWLTGGDEWKCWIDGNADRKSQFLWIYGIPGAGKTFLACSMIKKVSSHVKTHGKTQGLASAYYYCYHGRKSGEKDEAVNLLRSVISQLCAASKSIPVILNDLFDSRCQPGLSDLLDCLEAVLTKFSTAYIVVDAVDESDPRPKLIDVLSKLASETRFAKIRLAATSRDYPEIRKAFEPRSVSINMANSKVTDDIRKYVTTRLQDERCQGWRKELRDKITLEVPINARGMFRYAACQLDILADCKGSEEVERICNSLPKTLDETYERILRAIPANHKDDVIRALAIVIGSLGNTGQISINTVVGGVKTHHERGSFFDANTLRKQCVSLIKVDTDETAHTPQQTVTLAHYTVREFLESSRIKASLPDFHLPTDKSEEIFCNTIMLAASQYKHKDDADLRNVREYRNGDPVDFTMYGLRNTRASMFWNWRPFLKDTNKQLTIDLLNPYGPSFRGLQLLGSDDHSDTANEQLFEWVVQFDKKATAIQKAAAHLAILLGFHGQTGLAEAFLKNHAGKKAALFKTEMDVTFPLDWKLYGRRGPAGGGYDSKPTSVTVIGLYEEGLKRGYDTKTKIKVIRDNFGSYLPAKGPVQKAPAPAPAPTNSNAKSTPGHGTSTPADKPSASGESSRGRGTRRGGGAQSSQKKPDPGSSTSGQKKPQIQSHGQPPVQSHQGRGNQGQNKPQAPSPSQGQNKSQAPSPNQGQAKFAQSTGTPTTNNGAPNRNPKTTQVPGSSGKDTARG